MVHMTYFVLKEKKLSCSIFTVFFGGCKVYFFCSILLNCVLESCISEFFGHKLLHLRYCKGPESSSVCTNMDSILQVPLER